MSQFVSDVSIFPPLEADALLTDIKSVDPEVRKAALVAVWPLVTFGESQRLVRAIADTLTDAADTESRALAAHALAAAGRAAREVLPRLAAALRDPEPRVRRAAAVAVGQIGDGDSAAVAGLVTGLADPDEGVREQCATALADLIGTEGGEEHDTGLADSDLGGAALAGAAQDPVSAVRRAAVGALVAFAERGILSDGIGEVAARALVDPDPGVRREGLRLVSAANLSAAESLPRLIALLGDPDAGLRRLAARALGRLGADAAPAVQALQAALNDADQRVARAAAEALALVSFDRQPWTPYLLQIREFAGPARPALRERAIRLLDAPVEVVAAWLGELVDDRDEGIRWNAGLGLWRCGTSAGVAAAALSRMLTDHSSALRVAAVVGLLGAGPAAGLEAARALALRLKDDELWVRQLAAVALGAIGTSDNAVLPALTAATGDDREEVRNAAAEAIRRIAAR